mmetsp:Transcript_104869/g.277073  ORF Transcript_104869/g.277073 Transcript_104869/m.277073 type:complete len:272 (-) Transcript_104869:631-1446(-)
MQRRSPRRRRARTRVVQRTVGQGIDARRRVHWQAATPRVAEAARPRGSSTHECWKRHSRNAAKVARVTTYLCERWCQVDSTRARLGTTQGQTHTQSDDKRTGTSGKQKPEPRTNLTCRVLDKTMPGRPLVQKEETPIEREGPRAFLLLPGTPVGAPPLSRRSSSPPGRPRRPAPPSRPRRRSCSLPSLGRSGRSWRATPPPGPSRPLRRSCSSAGSDSPGGGTAAGSRRAPRLPRGSGAASRRSPASSHRPAAQGSSGGRAPSPPPGPRRW